MKLDFLIMLIQLQHVIIFIISISIRSVYCIEKNNGGINSISLFKRKNPGEIIGDFVLIQRLDLLGVKKEYSHEYYVPAPNGLLLPAKNDLSASNLSRRSDIGIDSSSGTLTVAQNIRLGNGQSTFIRNGSYYLESNIFNGGHGEIWRAHLVDKDGILELNSSFVLKRMHVKDKPNILRCALREIFFGEITKGFAKVARYISNFQTEEDYWLVFRDEGVSLQNLLYAMTFHNDNALLEPSAIWKKLRTTQRGAESMKGLLHQLISSISYLHKQGITHRDIKPSNILINAENEAKLLIADFSSAVSSEAISKGLYGEEGPTTKEESPQYMPPEVLFSNGIPYDKSLPESYDSWSVGVVLLEMILGTADVFTVDQRTSALITHRLKQADEKNLNQALLLAAMADFCLYDPSSAAFPQNPNDISDEISSVVRKSAHHHVNYHHGNNKHENFNDIVEGGSSSLHVPQAVAALLHPLARSVRCGLSELALAIQRRDPLGIGFHDPWGLHLLSHLLAWNASHRIKLGDALRHAYFVGPYKSTLDGSLHPTAALRKAHDVALTMEFELSKKRERSESYDLTNGEEDSDYGSEYYVDWDVELMSESESEVDEWRHASQAIAPLAESVVRLMTQSLPQSSRHHSAEETWQDIISFDDSAEAQSSHNNENTKSNGSFVDEVDTVDSEETTEVSISDGLSFLTDTTSEIVFVCPHCGRRFIGDWASCDAHVNRRKHGRRCEYVIDDNNPKSQLPLCLSEHSLLPLDSQSGWCDLRGRRRHIEDAHAVMFSDHFKSWAVYDGHFGSRAAKFASRQLHHYFENALYRYASSNCISNDTVEISDVKRNDISPEYSVSRWIDVTAIGNRHRMLKDMIPKSPNEIIIQHNNFSDVHNELDKQECHSVLSVTALDAVLALEESFTTTHTQFLASNHHSERSGTTATVAVLFDSQYLLVGHVGDSRAIMCCDEQGLAIPLTIDHTPYNSAEAERVVARGGWIEKYGVLRVNGQLAVTRSLGDQGLRDVLSETPDILMLKLGLYDDISISDKSSELLSNTNSSCLNYIHKRWLATERGSHATPSYSYLNFLVVGSDGLWDVISNQDAVDFVCDKLLDKLTSKMATISENDVHMTSNELDEGAMHETARMLAQEAYVRGSMDNIGVCIVQI